MARRRRKTTKPARRRKASAGAKFTDEQKLQLLANPNLDEDIRKKILKA